jgi:hypothetical protein
MFGRGVVLKGKTFHSIVIVVPLHVSKFYRVLKKLTASPRQSPISEQPMPLAKLVHRGPTVPHCPPAFELIMVLIDDSF